MSIRCDNNISYCEWRRTIHGDSICEGAQEACPDNIVISMWEDGKSMAEIESKTNLDVLEIDDILTKEGLK